MTIKSRGVALITGGAKRIGCAMALFLAKEGFDIVIHYNDSKKEAQNLAREIEEKYLRKCEIISADLRDVEAVKNLANFMKKFTNWNLLINSASIFRTSKFLDESNNELFDNLNLHFIAPLILSKEFANHIQANKINGAQIINMIDKNIARYKTKYFYYLLSKKFLAEFTKMSALQLAPKIRVNAIAPGLIKFEETNLDDFSAIEKKIPLAKAGKAEDITCALQYLLDNKFITGEILFVDGGAKLNHAG